VCVHSSHDLPNYKTELNVTYTDLVHCSRIWGLE